MHGGTEKPNFSIDVAAVKTDFADAASASVRENSLNIAVLLVFIILFFNDI